MECKVFGEVEDGVLMSYHVERLAVDIMKTIYFFLLSERKYRRRLMVN